MNLNPKVMKTQVSNNNGQRKFETLSEQEMNLVTGGTKKPKKEKDIFDPDEE